MAEVGPHVAAGPRRGGCNRSRAGAAARPDSRDSIRQDRMRNAEAGWRRRGSRGGMPGRGGWPRGGAEGRRRGSPPGGVERCGRMRPWAVGSLGMPRPLGCARPWPRRAGSSEAAAGADDGAGERAGDPVVAVAECVQPGLVGQRHPRRVRRAEGQRADIEGQARLGEPFGHGVGAEAAAALGGLPVETALAFSGGPLKASGIARTIRSPACRRCRCRSAYTRPPGRW